jgi:nucleoid-associated protein YgaU
VRKGDLSLYDIGQKLGVSWQAIAKANGIKYPWTIHIGDVLIIP